MQTAQAQVISFTPVVNPQELVDRADPIAFAEYQVGAELHMSPGGTKHSWWLSKAGNKDEIFFQWPEGSTPSEAFFAFARKDPATDQVNGSRRSAKQTRNTWSYDQEVYKASVQRWNRAHACAKEFNDLAGSRQINLQGLREFSLHLARSLKRGNACPMLGDKVDVYEDLCAMGLAAVTPHGYITATDLLKQIKVPNAATLSKASAAH